MVAFKAEKNDGILDQFTRVSNMLVDLQQFMSDIKQGYQRLLGISLQILVAEVARQSRLVSRIRPATRKLDSGALRFFWPFGT